MEQTKQKEIRLNDWISLGLKLGITASLALVVAGLIMIIFSGDHTIEPFIRLDRIPAAIVITIGILILLLTPVIQIIVAIVLFAIAKNRLFLGISVAVLCFAAISLALVLI